MICCQVEENIGKAQEKQKYEYLTRQSKVMTVFDFKVGDKVMARINKNKGCKPGKTEAVWSGPYRYDLISNFLFINHL